MNTPKTAKPIKNKDWETASFAALMFSIRDYKDRLSETHGVKLNSRSREIDVRIIDQSTQPNRINHAIAYFFERHNLIELKNPKGQLNIDVFWKGISYAAQYKSSGYDDTTKKTGVNIKPMSDITLTFLRITKPEKLLDYLETHGFSLSQKFTGVYYVSGIAELKIQIVVGSELEGDEFVPLRVQKENASEDDIRKFIAMCGDLREQAEKDMAHTIMQISNSNNKELYDKIMEEKNMTLAIDKFIADRLAAKAEEGRAEGRNEGRAELLSRLQSSGMLTQEQIATIQNWQF
ncbi:MAG: hypothetical protein IJF90_06435 [Synergistaceae bacterium]|nr:hypothetical protein [Synergistaceae bacterium]